MTTELEEQVDALEIGRGFLDRSEERQLSVDGRDARTWLDGLVTGRLTDLEVGIDRRSLLLTPTGRIRADFTVSIDHGGAFLVVQPGDQAEPVRDILSPYVLSSAVTLADASVASVRWFPGTGQLLTPPDAGDPDDVEVDGAAFELWRVRRGIPRMGIDFPHGSLPAGSRLDEAIDYGKGCFLGQESVAKVRNLGHPPTVLRHLHSEEEIAPGTAVHTRDHRDGLVTSAVPDRERGWALLARVDWAAAGTDLSTSDGVPLSPIAD